MNKLSYGLLSLLSTQSLTGYDLTQSINKFWRSTHSAIYPLLSELEEKGYVQYTLMQQNGKPDKKIYSLTDQGMRLLHEWFIDETSEKVVRDEMSLKIYCMKLMDPDDVENLLNKIEANYKKKVEEYKNYLEKISNLIPVLIIKSVNLQLHPGLREALILHR
jgi:DNA-binding PadR family transcriptional regulator